MDNLIPLCSIEILIGIASLLIILAYYFNQTRSINRLKSQGDIDGIINILQDPAQLSRHREAIEALGDLGNPKAIESLADALKGPHAKHAARAIGKIGKTAIPQILALHKTHPQQLVVQALTAIGPPAISEMKNVLSVSAQSTDSRLRETAARVLDGLKWKPENNEVGAAYWISKRTLDKCVEIGALAVVPLIHALDEPGVSAEAAKALGEIGDARAINPLLSAAKNEQLRSASFQALVEIGTPAIPSLVAALTHADPDMRQAVASSLEQIGWQPPDDSSGATYWIIKRQWSKVTALGIHALQPLSEALKDADPQVRQSVVTTIGGIQSPGAVDLLLIALRDPDSEVRAATIRALGNMPPERSLPPLIASLQDASLHEAVVEALEHLGADIIPALLAALKDSDWKVKQGIADALEQLNWSPGGPLDDEEITALYYVAGRQWEASVRLGAPAVPPLCEALADTFLRQDAAQALGRIGDERAVEPLFQALQNETHPPVQRTIARALGQIGESSVDYMIRALEDHLIETNLAIFTLGMIGSPRAVPPLIEILIDRNLTWPQREAAATALGDIGIPSILPLIQTMRGKVEPRYAELISGALGRIGSPAIEPITSALAGKDIDVQAAILALGKIGDERAIEVILSVLRVKQYGAELRKAAIWALSQIGPAAVVPVINALGDRRMDKKAISMALVKIGSPAVEPLLVALNVSYGEVREIIVQILGQIGDARAIPALLNLLKDRNISRVIVNEAIKQIDHTKPDRIKPKPI